jgi:hypothetical protein
MNSLPPAAEVEGLETEFFFCLRRVEGLNQLVTVSASNVSIDSSLPGGEERLVEVESFVPIKEKVS